MWNLIIFVIVIFIIYKLSKLPSTSKEPESESLFNDFYYDKNGSFKTIKHKALFNFEDILTTYMFFGGDAALRDKYFYKNRFKAGSYSDDPYFNMDLRLKNYIIYTSIKKDSSTVEIYDKNENKLFSYIAEEYMDSRLRQPKNGLINGKELDSIDINDIYRIDEITQELIVYIKNREYINNGQKIL
jgi:hypothetical protein